MSETSTAATTGATPGAGATPAQVPQAEPAPQPASATPAASTTSQPAASATDDAALGDTGKRILADARRALKEAEDRAKALETERDSLKTATQSEAEKAQAAAVKEAEKRVSTEFEGRIRRAEVRRALTAAGIAESELELASLAPEFAKLKVDDNGDLTGISDVVAAFKAAHAGLFAKPATGNGIADLGGGVRGQTSGSLTREQIAAMSPEEAARRMTEIDAFMRGQSTTR